MMRFQVVETKVFIVDSYDETTAQMAVDALQNEMQITERCFGEAEGLTAEERMMKFPDQDIPGLEDIQVVRERVWNVLQTIASTHADESVIIVSHGGVINAVLSILSNGEIGTGITKLKNACLNHITYSNDEWTIHSYNNILHLER